MLMYKLLFFLHKTDDENVLQFFRDNTIKKIEGIIGKLSGLGLDRKYGYLRKYVTTGIIESFQRLEQIAELCMEGRRFGHQELNSILGIFIIKFFIVCSINSKSIPSVTCVARSIRYLFISSIGG